nr:uncharacterized protein LOC117277697 [Nicotiana tomentosiformis]
MAALSSKPNHVRSISLPGRSHPITQRVEEEINKLKSLSVAPTADTVYSGLFGLEKLYKRRKGDSTTDDSVARFTSFSKKIKRDAKRLALNLKQMDQETAVSVLFDADQDTIAAIRALREANAVCISTFQMLLSFLCVPLLKPKQSTWSLLSRLVQEDRIAPEVQEKNASLETRLETFGAYLDSIEKALEATFRCLIRSRSSLLNVLSC